MQVFFSKISNTQHELQIEVPSEDFEEYFNRAAKRLSENLEIQGFRKGNAPLNIVEQKVGSNAILSEAADIAMQSSYLKALDLKADSQNEEFKDRALKKIIESFSKYAASEISILKLARGNNFCYKIVFKTPFFDITKDYRDIASKVKKEGSKEVVVEDKEVEDSLKWLWRSYNKNSNQTSSNSQEEAVLDDKFAKTVGNFTGLEDLKKSIREGIYIEKEKREKDRLRMSILKGIIEKSNRDIPREVVDKEAKNIEEEFKGRISEMGIEFDEYLKKIAKKREDLEPGWREGAKERVEASLALDVVANMENIQPASEDIEKEARKVLDKFSSVKDAKKDISPERLKEYVYQLLRNEKTFEFLETL